MKQGLYDEWQGGDINWCSLPPWMKRTISASLKSKSNQLTSFLYISISCSSWMALRSGLKSFSLFRCSSFCLWTSSLSAFALRIAIRSSASLLRACSSESSDSRSFTVSKICWFRRLSSSTWVKKTYQNQAWANIHVYFSDAFSYLQLWIFNVCIKH